MYKLPETLTIHNVEAVKEELLLLLREASPDTAVTLDAAVLENMDSTGLQLLIAACSTFSKAGCKFELINITPSLRQILDLSGGMEVVETQ